MPDIFVAVDYAFAQSGKPYRTGPNRFGPDYYDCSGLIIASLRHATIVVPSDVGNTVGLYNWAKRVGGLVSVATGVKTRGAIMIKGKSYGYGPLGHASFSLGDGNEMAAHGRRSGIHSNRMRPSFYQDAFIIPGVNYHLEPAATQRGRDVEIIIIPPSHHGFVVDEQAYAIVAADGRCVELWNGASIGNDQPTSVPRLRRWTPQTLGTATIVGLTTNSPKAQDPRPGLVAAYSNGDSQLGLFT